MKYLHGQMRRQLEDVNRPWRRPVGVPSRKPEHPGRFLERLFLSPLGLTQGQAARLLGVSRRRLNEIVVGRRGLSPDTALRCAVAFGLDVGFWLSLQARWDAHQAWTNWRGQAITAAPISPATPQNVGPSGSLRVGAGNGLVNGHVNGHLNGHGGAQPDAFPAAH
jgi:addiction module HigA family antidote